MFEADFAGEQSASNLHHFLTGRHAWRFEVEEHAAVIRVEAGRSPPESIILKRLPLAVKLEHDPASVQGSDVEWI